MSPDPHRDTLRNPLLSVARGVAYDKELDMFWRSPSSLVKYHRPLSVCIAPVATCNLRCATCLSDSGPSGIAKAWPSLVDVLGWMRSWAPARLVWTGGEPTLYPELSRALQMSSLIGCHNVVCTNAATHDPCSELAGEFFYSVSIYGKDRQSYLAQTGCDKFSRFVRIFEQMFSHGHKVIASLRLDQQTYMQIPEYLSWLSSYPLRKIALLNTRIRGRIGEFTKPVSAAQLDELRKQTATMDLSFPVVFPLEPSMTEAFGGLIVLEHNGAERYGIRINGKSYRSFVEAQMAIGSMIDANVALFSSENYALSNSLK